MKAAKQNRIIVAFIMICDGTNTDTFTYGNTNRVDLLTAYNGHAITYDPFGKPLTATGTMASINPLRYRGYYYDKESGLYYLKSRYYDPGICRFINADDASFVGADGEYVSYNLFAYCKDNPITNSDPSGKFVFTSIMIAAVVTGAVVGGVVGGVFGAINAEASGGDPVLGAVCGTITGLVTGGVTGLAGCLGAPALFVAAGANALFAAAVDVAGQMITHNKKEKSDQAEDQFQPDLKSAGTAAFYAATGTLGGVALSCAGSVIEATLTTITGGYFATLISAVFEMVTRKIK